MCLQNNFAKKTTRGEKLCYFSNYNIGNYQIKGVLPMLTVYQNYYYLIIKNHQCFGAYTVSELAKSIINAYHLDINILNHYQDVTSLIQYSQPPLTKVSDL